MGDVVYLVKPKTKRVESTKEPRTAGSAVVIEVERGQLRQSLVTALSSEDASALLTGLAMAIVQVIRAQQIL